MPLSVTQIDYDLILRPPPKADKVKESENDVSFPKKISTSTSDCLGINPSIDHQSSVFFSPEILTI